MAYRRFAAQWPAPLLDTPPPRPRPAPRLIEYAGRTQTLTAWAREVGLKPGTLAHRLDVRKWPVGRALTTPARSPAPRPRLERHEPSGRAFVRWSHRGKRLCRYLGAWGSDGAAAAYADFLQKWELGKV